jgi:pimeloyl-ACP methyl ester carboxylesterase
MTMITLPDGRELETEISGPEDGRVLVFHHGTPGCHLQLPQMQQAAAERGLRLVTWARPGYAGSTRHHGRTVASVAADTAAVLDVLGAEDCLVAGRSGGGPHALACAALLPDRVRAALVIAGVGPHDAPGLEFMAGMGADNVKEFGAAEGGEAELVPFLEQWRPELLEITGEQIATSLTSLLPPVDVAILDGDLADHLAEGFRVALSRGVEGWCDDDLAFVTDWGFALDDVRVPVSIWQGSEDLMVPFSHGEWLASHVPGATAHLQQGEGHLSVAVRELGDVLDELVAAAG